MKVRMFSYGLTGLFIGLIVGATIGYFSLAQVKKTMRGQAMPYAIVIGALFIGLGGYAVGSRIGKASFIEERLGMHEVKDNYIKDGKYWVGITKWTDRRDNKEYTLMTGRSNQKHLASALNGRAIILHDETSASQKTIPKYHGQAKQHVFNTLKENYTEEPKDIEWLIPTIG